MKTETPEQRKLRFIRHAINSRIGNAKAEVASLSKAINRHDSDYDIINAATRRHGYREQIAILEEIKLYKP